MTTSDKISSSTIDNKNTDGLYDTAVDARDSGDLASALLATLGILAKDPASPRGRVLLAQLFYNAGCVELAVEFVTALQKKYPERQSLQRLLSALEPSSLIEESASGNTSEESSEALQDAVTKKSEKTVDDDGVIAEADFDFDDIELLDDE